MFGNYEDLKPPTIAVPGLDTSYKSSVKYNNKVNEEGFIPLDFNYLNLFYETVLGTESKTTSDTEGKTNTNSEGKYKSKELFIKDSIRTYKLILSDKGLDLDYAYVLTSMDCFESGWGKHLAGDFNYGGIKGKGSVKRTFEYINGKKTYINDSFRNFNSLKDFCEFKVNLLLNSRYRAFDKASANNPYVFVFNVISSGYATAPPDLYAKQIKSIYNKIKYNE